MIVLLTDFGQGEYVGAMKGVVYGITEKTKIVDLCHEISPQSVIEAAWILKNNYKYFPTGTIFCCVVDPGVGTERKALAIKTEDYYFVRPDNGLMWEAVKQQKIIDVRQIPIPKGASRTFHGRDVFAKAGAALENGDDVGGIGEKTELKQKLEFGMGEIVHIDEFGNIVTNIPHSGKEEYSVKTGNFNKKLAFHPSYTEAGEGLFLIEGSSGTLEISIKNNNANKIIKANIRDKISVV